MKLALILYNLGAVAVILFFLYFWIKKIAPKIKATSKKLEEEKSKKLLEKNKKIFQAIFNFLPGDGNLKRHEEISKVNKIINELFNDFKENEESLENLNVLAQDIYHEGKLIKTDEIIIFICSKHFSVLKNVNWGIGFMRMQDLESYASLVVSQKEELFKESKRVAIILGF